MHETMTDVLDIASTIASDCVAHRARQVARILTRSYDEAIRPLGIQMSQLSVLVAAAHGADTGLPMGQLARALLMDQTTVSRNVLPLEKSGLLRLVSSTHDARSRVVMLTPAGKRMIEAAYPRWKAAQRALEKLIGADTLETLHGELGAIVAVADELAE